MKKLVRPPLQTCGRKHPSWPSSPTAELGDLKVISEGVFNESNLPDGAFLLRAESADFDTPISTGEGAVTVNITGVYGLK